jgi:hypothetical protein
MPDYSQETYKQTKDRLTKWGAEIGSFNMGTFRTLATGDLSLQGGYCNGVLLDWVRRVLLSQSKPDEAFLTFHSGALEERKGTDKRTYEELKGHSSQTVKRMTQAWTSSGDMNWVGEADVNKPTAISPAEWQRTASAIDQVFDKQRAAAKRESSKKRFGSLELMAGEKKTYPDANQWMGALLFNTKDPILRPGYCT